MSKKNTLELQDFLPYLLNQAAEASSIEFQKNYKQQYGMLRTEWRVLFHIGTYGELTAKEIGLRGQIHKTKISRAVNALEKKRFLAKRQDDNDRRLEHLSLTKSGQAVFVKLSNDAQRYQEKLANALDKEELKTLVSALRKIAVSQSNV